MGRRMLDLDWFVIGLGTFGGVGGDCPDGSFGLRACYDHPNAAVRFRLG